MVMEKRPEQQEEDPAIIPATSPGIATVDKEKPLAPQGITDEETQELESRARDLVEELQATSGGRQLELIDSMTNLGMQAQRKAGSELDLLRGRVGDMITRDGPGAEVSRGLVELRLALKEINPLELGQTGLVRRLFSMVPIVGKLTSPLSVLEKIAIRYEPACRQVEVIESRLREGRMMLIRDNLELRQLYEQVEAQQLPIQKNAYLGELVMLQLSELTERADDTPKAERLRSALHDVSMRVQDLRTMEAAHTQFFVSVEMSHQNNTRLGQSVERTLTLAINVVTVGLAIQTALARQRRVLEATQRTREFLGDVIAANATAIRQHTEAIGDVYNNPVIAIDKITQAHNDLIEAMDIADRLKQEGIVSARENIAKLGQLSAELQRRASGLVEQRHAEVQSIEA